MAIALIVLWIVWLIPAVMYILEAWGLVFMYFSTSSYDSVGFVYSYFF